MELQNIALNFTENTITSYYTDKTFKIPVITNMSSLKAKLDSESGFLVVTAVVQYTVDQYGKGGEPRIVANDGGEETAFLPLSSISSGLSDALDIARTEVEAEITAQTI